MRDEEVTAPDGMSTEHWMIESDENAEEQVSEYAWRERYDPERQYNTEVFRADYGSGEHQYRYKCCVMHRREGTPATERWVVAAEELDETERAELERYCQCVACQRPWWALEGMFACRCCIGCLTSGFLRQHRINAARKAQASNAPTKKFKWTPLWVPMAYVGAGLVAIVAVGNALGL